MHEWVRIISISIYTGICAVQDLRYRQINLFISFVAAGTGLISVLLSEPVDLAALFTAMTPGGVLVAASLVSREQIGIGDAVFITVCGLYLSLEKVVFILIFTWMVCGGIALVIIINERMLRKGNTVICSSGGIKRSGTGIPFVTVSAPFVILCVIEKIINL